ncbi:hypothetical protein AMECASPLE_010723, partial [Ameca splendens]
STVRTGRCVDFFFLSVLFPLRITDKHGQPGCLGCGCSAGSVRMLDCSRTQEQRTRQR